MSYEAVIRDGTEQAVIIKDGLQYVVEVAGALGSQYIVEIQGASGAVSAEAARQNALIALANAAAALVSAENAAASEADAAASAAVADAGAVSAGTSATTAASIEAAILAALAGTTLTTLSLTASDRTVLAALSTTSSYPAILTEGKRGGVFKVVNYSDFSAVVDADTQQGVFVRSTFDSTKAWARIDFLTSTIMRLFWFGAQFDGSFNDWPAMSGALAVGAAMLQGPGSFGYASTVPQIDLPFGHGRFYANSCVLANTITIKGQSSGRPAGLATLIEWADGVDGFDCQAPGCRIEGVSMAGSFSGTESESHAITGSHTPQLRNLYIYQFSGDGFHFDSSVSGNLDGITCENVFVEQCRDGVFLDGPDTNTSYFANVEVKGCRRWAVQDSAFLSNTHIMQQYSNCGITPYNDGVNIAASMVSYSGNRYCLVGGGWDTWASTNPPSGTTADNPAWIYCGAGGTTTGVPAWFSGIKVRAGGTVYTDSINAAHQIIGCYAEGGQPLAQISAPAVVQGGALAYQVWQGSTGVVFSSGPGLNAAQFSTALKEHSYKGTDEDFYAMLGGPNTALKTVLYAIASVTFPNAWRMMISGADIVSNYANSDIHFTITGPNTTQKFNRTANQPHVFNPTILALGIGVNSRILGTSDGVPGGSDIAVGEVRFNVNPGPSGGGSRAGWIRTSAGAWRAFGGMAAAPTLTYTSPSGGTTIDSQCRNSLDLLHNELNDLRFKLQAAELSL